MGAKTEWRVFAAIGAILVAITFTDLSPEGPWNDSTFTSGSLGLIGLMLLYLAWFRLTFETNGVVPTMDLWKDPEGASTTVIGVGLVILGIAYAVGRIDLFPATVSLFGCQPPGHFPVKRSDHSSSSEYSGVRIITNR